MEPEHAADILEAMPPDEAADIMGDLSEDTAQELFRRMEKEDAEDVQELLGHEEDTAGGIMTTEFLSFTQEMTVSDALREYRLEAPNVEAASQYVLYVLDDEERLLGEFSLKDLVLSPPGRQLSELMKPEFKHIHPGEDDKDAAVTISKYNLLALPVIDDDRRMIGIITVDDALDLVLPPQSRRRKGRIG
jgi:Mg/Co/Ni transporter MgtE